MYYHLTKMDLATVNIYFKLNAVYKAPEKLYFAIHFFRHSLCSPLSR